MSDLREITKAALLSLGLNGLFDDTGDGCACTVDDLMPCDQPSPGCVGCTLRRVVNCGDLECEWLGEEHWHRVQPLAQSEQGRKP